jgi:hypothetical protein
VVVVDVGEQAEVEGVADLVGGHDPRAGRAVDVEGLADDHAGFEFLPIPDADIVDDGEPGPMAPVRAGGQGQGRQRSNRYVSIAAFLSLYRVC